MPVKKTVVLTIILIALFISYIIAFHMLPDSPNPIPLL